MTKEKEASLFAGLRRMRELERKHLPFARSLVEFDLIIEIGYHEERGKPLTFKHLLTLGLCARTTLNRRLNGLVDQGVLVRTRSENDGRAVVLGVSKTASQRLHRYRGGIVASLMDLS
jgi:DNA-binding MarR family transcriptional regulator